MDAHWPEPLRLFVWTWTLHWPELSPAFVWQLALLSYNHSLITPYCKPPHPVTQHLLARSCQRGRRWALKALLRSRPLLQIGLVLLWHDGIACYATHPRPCTRSMGKPVICWREGLGAANTERWGGAVVSAACVYFCQELVNWGGRWRQHSDDTHITDDILHVQINRNNL